jgi:hypothetical protein
MRKHTPVFVLLLIVASLMAAQTTRHPFNFDDIATLRNAEARAVSPDGKTVLYKVTFGASKGPDNTEWQLIATTGGEPRHLNIPEKFKPLGFTRDGTGLYGTNEVNKMAQLATLQLAPADTPAAAAATPLPLTALPKGIHSALISPDGKRYAVLADPRVFPTPWPMCTPSSKPSPPVSTSSTPMDPVAHGGVPHCGTYLTVALPGRRTEVPLPSSHKRPRSAFMTYTPTSTFAARLDLAT